MITPSYSPTATERVLPRLALDFTTASLDSRVTVTRALNTATAINSSGFVAVVNENLPRFNYDPVTLVCKGLLIEETRANLLTYSAQLENAAWTRLNASVAADATVSPDGTTNADKLIGLAGLTNIAVFQSPALTASTAYTETVYAKKSEWSWVALEIRGESIDAVQAWFNLDTGTVGTIVGAGTAVITNAGNGWYRCSLTRTTGLTTTSPRVRVYPTNANAAFSTGDGTSGIFVWGAQLEVGAFATSYIPTTTTSLTRNADVVSMTGTNFSSWYVSSSAALAAVVIPSIATGTRPIWQLDDTTANEIIALRGNVANPELYIVDNGTPQAQLDAGTITANTQYGLCAAFTANSCAASQNGAAPVTTATATMPTVTQARIGSDGSNFLNGVVQTLRYWPQRILNTETQAFSKL